MANSGAEAAAALAESLDEGRLVPSRELTENLAELIAAIARHHRREGRTLASVRFNRQ